MKKSHKAIDYIESDAPEENRTPRPIYDERIGRFGERVKMIVAQEKSRRSFARKVGLGESTVRNYENGERLPDLDVLLTLCDQSGVNLLWLATGEGPKYPEARGSPDRVYEESAPYPLDMRLGWIKKAVKAVQMMGKNAPDEQKAEAVARVYERFVQTDGQADMIEVMQIIQTALSEDAPYI